MNTGTPFCRSVLLLSALLFPAATFATSETDADRPATQTTSPAATEDATASTISAMRERMQQIRRTSDPELRRKLMEEQMADMEAIGQAGTACPMMGGPMMGGPMMRGGMGGSAMDQPEVLRQRIEALEKRVDMLQMMMQMGGGNSPMRGGGMMER